MKKRFGLVIIALTLVVSGVIYIMAYRANLELERVVTEQFNNQQLMLARKIASDISLHFSFLETALSSFGKQWTDAPENQLHSFTMPALLDFISDWGVLGIASVEHEETTPLVYIRQGWKRLNDLGLSMTSLSCADPGPEDAVCLSLTVQPNTGPFAGRWLMAMSARPSSAALDEPGEAPLSETSRLVFLLDAQNIAKRYAVGVRSGKTGYPWVIDHKGYFMYHVEEDFDGQDSFTIRRERNPSISYERINSLVEERLLKGEEGTDWYISGWHWEVIGEMKKLFAFSPVVLSEDQGLPAHVWSVGLAAPDTEVYGLIRPIVLRQSLILGLFFGLVVVAFASFLFIALRWSEALRREVDKKTEHLRESENALRQERDKVTASMDQLVQTQEKLVLSERFAAIGEAAAHLTHEIKNPLMLMGGFARQVLQTLPEDDQRGEKLRIIAGEAKRLETLLMEVRDFSRPPRPSKTLADMNETVKEVAALMQEKIRSQQVRLGLQLASDLPACRYDPDQIKQVLLNLVKNAVEAMPEGGELTIVTRREKGSLFVSVTDTGQGIGPEQLKKMFHPFFTTKPKGTGLGLAVSYKIVQDHGGEIFVRSRQGQGSRFSFILPLDERGKGPGSENRGRTLSGLLENNS